MKHGRRHRLIATAAAALAMVCLQEVPAVAQSNLALDNGAIRIGVDTARGGAIVLLQRSGTAGTNGNVVNSYDLGRMVQQSYYSGPADFQPTGSTQHPSWSPWPWNPVQAGDAYDNPSVVVASSTAGGVLYTKTVPKQWALQNVDSECTMEQWITLSGSVATVRNRLTNARSDTTQYAAATQELPAVYTRATLTNLKTYTGTQPFTGGAVSTRPNEPPPSWGSFRATEGWAAYVDANDWGLGIVMPGNVSFKGGFATSGTATLPTSPSTGYIAPVRSEIIDHNIVYDYTYHLVLGSVADIRAFAVANKPDLNPDFHFTGTRAGWTYKGAAADTGFPIADHLSVTVNGADPQMWSPETTFQAAEVPKLYIRAAYDLISGTSATAQVFWERDNGGSAISQTNSRQFSVVNDGQYRIYEVDVSSTSSWTGQISRLRFDPVTSASAGSSIDVQFISAYYPTTISIDVTSGTQTQAETRNAFLSGTFGVTKTGVGTLTLTSSNGFTGTTRVAAGGLRLGHAAALANSTFDTQSGTTGSLSFGTLTSATFGGLSGSNGLVLTNAATTPAAVALSVGANGQSTAFAGGLSGLGSLTKTGTGTLTLSGSSTLGGVLGVSNGTVAMTGGSHTMSGTQEIVVGHAATVAQNNAAGTLTITGGTLAITGTGGFRMGVNVSGSTTGARGTVNLDGGVLETARPFTVGTGSGTINLNGGTLRALASSTNFMSVTAARVGSGGAVIDTGTHAITITQPLVTSGSGSGGLTKFGGGTLRLSGSNTYTGSTVVSAGTLALGTNQSLTGPLVLGGSSGATTTAGMDLAAASGTFGGLTVQTLGSDVNRVVLGAGRALATNGNVTVGSSAATGTAGLVVAGTASGVGVWTIANSQASGSFQVGVNSASSNNAASVDLSALGTFAANLSGSNSVFRVGANSSNAVGGLATVSLAASSTITARTLGVGDISGETQTHSLLLGSGPQRLNADSVVVGNGSTTNFGRAGGRIQFAGPTGSVTLRAQDGAGRADVTMVSGGATTASNPQATLDVRGHDADLLVGTLAMSTLTGNNNMFHSTFSFDQGTLDVAAITMGSKSSTSHGTSSPTATLNLGSGSNTAVNTSTIGSIAMASHSGTSGAINAVFNVAGANTAVTSTGSWVVAANAAASGSGTSNGTVSISGGIVNANAGIVLRSRSGFGTVNGTVNVTGGTLVSGSHITSQGSGGAGTATLTLDGGRLDMSGFAIGGAGQTITANFRSGTLSNLANLNAGGAFTKSTSGTLVLTGTNGYTGATNVTGGRLVVNGRVSGTGGVALSAGTALGGSGSIGGGIGGAGAVAPGNSPGILTSSFINPTGGLDFNFELTGTGSPLWSDTVLSRNDVLRLTAATPITAAFTSANVLNVFFDVGSLAVGDAFRGGIFTDAGGSFSHLVAGATYNFFYRGDGLGSAATHGGKSYYALDASPVPGVTSVEILTVSVPLADFADGAVVGGTVMEFVVVPEPGALILVVAGAACLAGRLRARGAARPAGKKLR